MKSDSNLVRDAVLMHRVLVQYLSADSCVFPSIDITGFETSKTTCLYLNTCHLSGVCCCSLFPVIVSPWVVLSMGSDVVCHSLPPLPLIQYVRLCLILPFVIECDEKYHSRWCTKETNDIYCGAYDFTTWVTWCCNWCTHCVGVAVLACIGD